MAERRVEEIPEFFEGRDNELLRKIAQGVNDLQKGRGNNHFDVTLDPNSLTTIVIATDADTANVVQFSALSASAAVAIAAGVVWAESTFGQIIIHHDSQPDTDRRLGVLLIG
jgi:hypothetical protein